MTKENKVNLLLLSNGRKHGMKLFEHAKDWIASVFPPGGTVMFVPFALKDHEDYYKNIADALAPMGLKVVSAHHAADPVEFLKTADGVFIGGGNTFRLLKSLEDTGLKAAIAEAVKNGMPYMGSSAGTNMACPTLKTTNDMPIVQPKSFNALGLIDFQINPHYLDADPSSTHMGETREERIAEFHEENTVPVVGLREGTALRIKGGHMELLGDRTARVFFRNAAAVEVPPGPVHRDLKKYAAEQGAPSLQP